jgi:pyruvate dehydrogenase E1 component alpha subunit
VYRTPEEIETWKGRDPIERFASLLQERGLLDPGRLEALRAEVSNEVAEAISAAAAASAPDPANLFTNVYGDPHTPEQFARMGVAAPFGEDEETRTWRT